MTILRLFFSWFLAARRAAAAERDRQRRIAHHRHERLKTDLAIHGADCRRALDGEYVLPSHWRTPPDLDALRREGAAANRGRLR